MDENKYNTGLYLHLSNDDAREGESLSIENQRNILTKYADERSFDVTEIYIDDGWSGTNFQRPALLRMLHDAKIGKINLIIVKDLSRLGRNYLEVGRMTEELFPKMGVRFISIGDCVDSLTGDSEIAAYRNLFNDITSKELSRKVRLAKHSNVERGKYLGTYAPFGYRKNPENKYHLIVDVETSDIVKRIFGMRFGGLNFHAIAQALNSEKIPTPRMTYYKRKGKSNPIQNKESWMDSTIKVILKNKVYIGNMVQGKCGTVSYKNHKIMPKPKDDWIRVENTHEALITKEIWKSVRDLEEKNFRPRKTNSGKENIFVGLLKCADCDSNMKM